MDSKVIYMRDNKSIKVKKKVEPVVRLTPTTKRRLAVHAQFCGREQGELADELISAGLDALGAMTDKEIQARADADEARRRAQNPTPQRAVK